MSYTLTENHYVSCLLCPKVCKINDGDCGDCGIRFNKSGKLDLPYYGILSAINIDPVEKKPLYHFFPGSLILSAGFYGCSFHCPFCQNFQISQEKPALNSQKYVSPENLIDLVGKNSLSSVAFTYSEPLVHFEYILKASKIARQNKIKTVLVTNGYINKKPAKELLPFIDALNIDLKAFTESFYSTELGGSLRPVLDFITEAASSSHVEITTLVIPGKNDSDKEIKEIARFIASVDSNIPLHLSAYYPSFHYTDHATPESTIERLVKSAHEYLPFVYPGNTVHLDNNTYCTNCGSLLVKRQGFKITQEGIKKGKCSNCGKEVPFKL